MKRALLIILIELIGFLCLFAAQAHGQSISPLIGEGGKGRMRGQFAIENVALHPIAVTVEARAFTLNPDGGVVAAPLDSTTEVQLTETSARIGAKQSHKFDYAVHCHAAQCGIVFETSNYLGRTKDGLLVRVVLQHFVYVCESGAKGCREKMRKGYGLQ